MKFENLQELQGIIGLLVEADFEQANWRMDSQNSIFILETARPASGDLKAGGLFRKQGSTWLKCRLVIQKVESMSIWEEYDVKPPVSGLLQVEHSGQGVGFRIRLASAHGLRIDLMVRRLDGVLEDLGPFG